MLARVRRVSHVLLAMALYYSGALGFLQLVRRRVLHENRDYVLGFHRILVETEKARSASLPGMILDESVFASLLDYLRQRMQFITLETFLRNGAGSDTRGKPCCLVTFDDGWSDTGARAVPLLRHKATPAVVFVPAGIVGSREGFWIERLLRAWSDGASRPKLAFLAGRFGRANGAAGGPEAVIEWLKRMPSQQREEILAAALPPADSDGAPGIDAIMTWEQLAQAQASGVEIGGHTVTHPLLSYEDEETVDRELRLCRQLLEQKLGAPVRAFAYPNGDWNPKVRERVKAAGYACAFTTEARCCTGKEDRFELPRFLLHDGNVTGLRGKFSPAMLTLTLAGWA